MGSPQPQVVQKPHAVCLPFPVQGHIKPMLDLAKLLHSRGFYITFINTEFNQRRLIKSGALNPTVQIDGFRFETIPDGLDTPEMDATQNVRDLAYATSKRCLGPLKQLIERLNGDSECGPYISFMIRDASMRFAQRLDLGMVDVTLWTMSACSYMGFLHYEELGRRGYTPFKDASWFSNGYLDTPIDWIPAMPNMRLKDLPTFIRTTNPDDLLLNYGKREPQAASATSAVIINTFEELDHDLISAIGDKFTKRRPYSLGPLSALSRTLVSSILSSPIFGRKRWGAWSGLTQEVPLRLFTLILGALWS
ncbi:hypothetical protein MRB53_033519 [Persea americana]|uniref:Uncharacterized protein n=1 Tax=Persea americana TaxID=3435 RepID=A0ACC2KW42_PERAE|nr:hypothetical protein MRB53_033519 [Persea americana]